MNERKRAVFAGVTQDVVEMAGSIEAERRVGIARSAILAGMHEVIVQGDLVGYGGTAFIQKSNILGVLQGLFFKNDVNDANFMGNEENTATNVAWRERYVKDMNDRPPLFGWTGDIFSIFSAAPEGIIESLRSMINMRLAEPINISDNGNVFKGSFSSTLGRIGNLFAKYKRHSAICPKRMPTPDGRPR